MARAIIRTIPNARGSTVIDFFHKVKFTVRTASTANVANLSTDLENTDSFGGVTLATNNIILLKNQINPAQNGIYVVQATGAPVRHPGYLNPSDLDYAKIFVSEGTNINTMQWQTQAITSFADQIWSTTAPMYEFIVPDDVSTIEAQGMGGGGGGGTGRTGADGSNVSGGGGGGGGGIIPFSTFITVTPGETITVQVGAGGAPSANGSSSILTGSFGTTIFPGADGGTGGGSGSAAGPGGSGYASPYASSTNMPTVYSGGGGAAGAPQPGTGGAGADAPAGTSAYYQGLGADGGVGGGAGYNGGGGGGGAPGMGIGGNGGRNSTWPSNPSGTPGVPAPDSSYGAGGGGGGGGSEIGSGPGGRGGWGADGFVRITY